MEKVSWRHLSHRTINLLFVDTHEWNYISKRLVNYLETKHNLKTLFLSFLILFAGTAMAQDVVAPSDMGNATAPQVETSPIFQVVEQMPEYPGGTAALLDYLRKNVRYPEVAKEAGIEGRVIVRFVVDEFGAISDIKLLKDIGGGCGQEAIRVVSKMMKWKPAMQNGKPVKTYMTLPVMFRLT